MHKSAGRPRIVPISSIFLALPLFLGCATLGSEEKKDELTIAAASEADFKEVKSNSKSGIASYEYKGRPFKVEWMTCRRKAGKTIFVMHRDKAGFSPKLFCKGWIAQAFLASGFDVVTVNRPGFGLSTGTADFAGHQSMEALAAGLTAALATDKGLERPSGIWGYSSGASAAALLAQKKLKDLKFLILGGGIYDLEETLENGGDSYVKKELQAIKKSGGDSAFEYRSIAYDSHGLPKRIAIYHGKADKAVPPKQAESFRDSLLTEEYKATIQVIDGVSHEIPMAAHRHILQVMAQAMAGL